MSNLAYYWIGHVTLKVFHHQVTRSIQAAEAYVFEEWGMLKSTSRVHLGWNDRDFPHFLALLRMDSDAAISKGFLSQSGGGTKGGGAISAWRSPSLCFPREWITCGTHYLSEAKASSHLCAVRVLNHLFKVLHGLILTGNDTKEKKI